MSGTSVADWFYLLAVVGAPLLFAAAMVYAFIRLRKVKTPPTRHPTDQEQLPTRGTPQRPGPPD